MDVAQVQFALDLVRDLSWNSTTSLIVSPLSVILALSLAYIGSNGDTRKEWNKKFGLNDTNETQFYNHLGNFVKNNEKSNSSLVEVWNQGYAPLESEIIEDYQLKLKTIYGASIEKSDFTDQQKMANKVNKDVEEHTHGKIKKIAHPYMFNRNALILVNTIYLKAKWFNSFDSSQNDTFHSSSQSNRQVEMMHMATDEWSAGCQYSENSDFELLRLPYAKKKMCKNQDRELADLHFNLLLPKKRFELENELKKEGKLNATVIIDLFNSLESRDVIVDMPSFSVEFQQSLRKPLRHLGLKNGFSVRANFGGISNAPYFIKDVVHKAKIEVNKEGTEASAATLVEMHWESDSSSGRVPIKICADQPFFYAITNKQNDIIFAGVYK